MQVRFLAASNPALKAQAAADALPAYAYDSPAEAALLVGLRQFPDSSMLNILYGSFVAEALGDPNRGSGFVERARGMAPSPRERFMMFTHDRGRKQRAQGESAGEGAMDLVSYVEFQNNFTSLLKIHRGALRANRRFWRLLIHSEISFRELSVAFDSMDKTEAKADRTYRSVMERYPKSVKLLRSYAGFLEEVRRRPLAPTQFSNPLVQPIGLTQFFILLLQRIAPASPLPWQVRNNPWAARKYHDEADKLDEAAADGGGEGGEGGEEGAMQVNDKTDAVAVITPGGIITVVNKTLIKMFGYRKQEELIGKNVSCLSECPAPSDSVAQCLAPSLSDPRPH